MPRLGRCFKGLFDKSVRRTREFVRFKSRTHGLGFVLWVLCGSIVMFILIDL